MPEATAVAAEQSTASQTATPPPSSGEGAAQGVGGDNAPSASPGPVASASTTWRDGLDGEALEFAKTSTSPQDVVKRAVELRKINAQMVRVPGKDAKPEDVAKFAKAIGAAEKPEDYKFPSAEGRELNDDEKSLYNEFASVFHKHHVPLAAVPELEAVIAKRNEAAEAERERLAVEGRKNSEAGLRKELGADYEGNVQLSVRAVNAFGDDNFRRLLNEVHVDGVKLGDHPDVIRVFGKIGRRMGEGQFIGAVGPEQVASLDQEIDTKSRAMHLAHAKGDRIEAKRLNDELFALQEKRHGNGPIVGREGRSV